jgi:sugar O-acyltransferase (sialic acid O-acetyltransferase NeuD family)
MSLKINFSNIEKVRYIILGAGGHGRVICDILRYRVKSDLLVFLDDDPQKQSKVIDGVRVIGSIEALFELVKERKDIKAIPAFGDNKSRRKFFQLIKEAGVEILDAVHPKTVISPSVKIGEGFVAMAGAIVNPGVKIGENVCINTNAVVEHDCYIGAHVHIFPGAVITGGVRIEDGCHIGSGAVINPYLKIGQGSYVGSGAVVKEDIPPGLIVAGVPARKIREVR